MWDRRISATVAWVLAAVLGVASCATGTPSGDLESLTPIDGRVVELPGGARVVFADALPPTAVLTVSTNDAPKVPDGVEPLSTPIHLELTGADLGSGATVEFPLPRGIEPTDVPATISTYDERLGAWVAVDTQVDAQAGVVRTSTTHFSWWVPWTWDWAGIGATVNQAIGEVVNKRAGQAVCERGQNRPAWVRDVVGVSNDPAVVIRGCVEGEGDALAVELVNNRPYGQILTYGSAVKWGWHETGSTALDATRDALMDVLVGPGALYLPPLGRASVGILPTRANSATVFRISPDARSFVGDLLTMVGPSIAQKVGANKVGPLASTCVVALAQTPPIQDLGNAGLVTDALRNAAACLKEGFVAGIEDGVFDQASVGTLMATFDAFKKATLVGRILQGYDVEWKLLDLYVDKNLIGLDSQVVAGFTVYASAAPVPESEPAPAPAPAPGPAPEPGPAPAPEPAPAPAPEPAPAPAPEPAPAPAPAPPPASRGFVIADTFLGGTWARTTPDDGTWYSKGNRPANAKYWFPNGLGVAVDCTRSAAPTVVHWADGRQETWTWWAHVTDNTWIPVAVLDAATADGDQGLAHC